MIDECQYGYFVNAHYPITYTTGKSGVAGLHVSLKN